MTDYKIFNIPEETASVLNENANQILLTLQAFQEQMTPFIIEMSKMDKLTNPIVEQLSAIIFANSTPFQRLTEQTTKIFENLPDYSPIINSAKNMSEDLKVNLSSVFSSLTEMSEKISLSKIDFDKLIQASNFLSEYVSEDINQDQNNVDNSLAPIIDFQAPPTKEIAGSEQEEIDSVVNSDNSEEINNINSPTFFNKLFNKERAQDELISFIYSFVFILIEAAVIKSIDRYLYTSLLKISLIFSNPKKVKKS